MLSPLEPKPDREPGRDPSRESSRDWGRVCDGAKRGETIEGTAEGTAEPTGGEGPGKRAIREGRCAGEGLRARADRDWPTWRVGRAALEELWQQTRAQVRRRVAHAIRDQCYLLDPDPVVIEVLVELALAKARADQPNREESHAPGLAPPRSGSEPGNPRHLEVDAPTIDLWVERALARVQQRWGGTACVPPRENGNRDATLGPPPQESPGGVQAPPEARAASRWFALFADPLKLRPQELEWACLQFNRLHVLQRRAIWTLIIQRQSLESVTLGCEAMAKAWTSALRSGLETWFQNMPAPPQGDSPSDRTGAFEAPWDPSRRGSERRGNGARDDALEVGA